MEAGIRRNAICYKTELHPIIVFHGRHFVCHLGICNPICLEHLQIMSGVIPRNLLKKRLLYLQPFSWRPQTRIHTDAHTQTHTQTHMTIAISEMQCVAFRLKMKLSVSATVGCRRTLLRPRTVWTGIWRQLKRDYSISLQYYNKSKMCTKCTQRGNSALVTNRQIQSV